MAAPVDEEDARMHMSRECWKFMSGVSLAGAIRIQLGGHTGLNLYISDQLSCVAYTTACYGSVKSRTTHSLISRHLDRAMCYTRARKLQQQCTS
eukprot:1147182-Pelagomonas_calceolata.AAC.4